MSLSVISLQIGAASQVIRITYSFLFVFSFTARVFVNIEVGGAHDFLSGF